MDDELIKLLDELAEIAKYWKKHREQGNMPSAIKEALLQVIQDINEVRRIEAEEVKPEVTLQATVPLSGE
jgi:Cft2 family RNA processing exonuclease